MTELGHKLPAELQQVLEASGPVAESAAASEPIVAVAYSSDDKNGIHLTAKGCAALVDRADEFELFADTCQQPCVVVHRRFDSTRHAHGAGLPETRAELS